LKTGLANRGYDTSVLEKLVQLDNERRSLQTELDNLRRIRNEKSQQVGRLKREGKDTTELLKELKGVSNKISELEDKKRSLDAEFHNEWSLIPNIPHVFNGRLHKNSVFP